MSHGLTAQEAAARFASHGPNELSAKKRLTGIVEFFVRFKNPLIIILLFAAGIEFFVGEIVSAVLIIVMVVLSIVIDFTNTYRSERAAEALRDRVKITATVVRDGVSSELPLREIVPGDVVLLTPGDIIPADGKLTDGRDFFVNESALTGESFPAEKQQGGEVFMGSSVVSGSGEMVVELTGRDTKFGKVAISLTGADGPTEFERSIKDFSYLIMKIIFVLVIFVFFVNAFSRPNILESFLFAAALAVGLTPELLPMIIAINLAKGSIVMAKHGVIVKRPASIQNFGSMDVFCTDKTGTLTNGSFGIYKILPAGTWSENDVLQKGAGLNQGSEHPLAPATILEAKKRGIILKEVKNFERVAGRGARGSVGGETVLIGNESFMKEVTILIPADILSQTRGVEAEGKTMAFVAISGQLVGVIALSDTIRKESREAIQSLRELGIRTAMVTGDSPDVAEWVARELGIDEYFARVLPSEKVDKVKILQAQGHKVAMVGDGVNDAPALTQADLGIAIGAGTNVAIESAGIILVKNDPRDIPKIIRLSQLTYTKMIQNLFWATGYNLVALPLAAGVLFSKGVILQPAVAAVFMSVSTVIVALNALLLRRKSLSTI